jgi:hypothetical protein
LNNKLLRRVGQFIYGEQWHAPLARDLGVNERSMRRWSAGTDEIPRSVWDDLGSKLEIWHRALGGLLAEVKHASELVEVHSFEVWDHRAGEKVRSPRKSTTERIAKVGGEIIPNTSEWVPRASVDADGRVKEKQRQTPAELTDLIADRLGISRMQVSVNKDPAHGWRATVYGASSNVHRDQLRAEQIARELRTRYDLDSY